MLRLLCCLFGKEVHCSCSRYVSSLGNKRVELFDMEAGASDPTADDNVQMESGEIRTLFISASEQFVEHDVLF
ncbi:putative plant SNARE 13 [Camellia lanceoleosa]|uniref:Plant SNARE 13 n=1 Tax=Camellia lanceoleosa TaxID=1840588 RepID=A0ACC0GGX6_9ERIC|nr:putative plant SNARE 13 [Camellia lanceoleosa]